MSIFAQLVEYLTDGDNWSGSEGMALRLLEHLAYTAFALAIATAIALPVGLLIGHTGKGAFFAINVGNAARAIPSFGLLLLLVLAMGLGLTPALVALVVLAIPPIISSTYAGVRGVDPATIDAARGMGMTERGIVRGVELPIALPLVVSGMRSATLQIVATATIAAYISLGGLGRLVIDGFAVRDFPRMLAGAVLVAALAIVLDLVLVLAQRLIVSDGLSGRAAAKRAAEVTEQTEPEPAR